MKLGIIVLLILFTSNVLFAKSDWRQTDDLDGVDFVASLASADSNNCFLLVQHSLNTKLYKSTDQGNSWKIIFKSDPFNEPPLYLINAKFGACPTPDYYYMMMEDFPVLKKSIDGGRTYRLIPLDTLDWESHREMTSFAMYDTSIGFAVSGDWYFITKNGWEKFEKKNTFVFPIGGYDHAVFLDSNTVGLTYSDGINKIGQYFVKYHIDTDKWEKLHLFPESLEKSGTLTINDLFFVNDSLGFACGKKKTGFGDTGFDIIFRTKDGGYNWKLILDTLTNPTMGLGNISFYDENNGVAVGRWGKIYTTNNGGNTWIKNELPTEIDTNVSIRMWVTWAGRTPIAATWGCGVFRYEGDFFDFTPDTTQDTVLPVIQTEDYDFGEYDISNTDSLSKKLKIQNISSDIDLKITGYSALSDSAFSTKLPEIDSLNPLIIKPNEFYEFEVSFKPKEVKQYRDSIVFHSNAKKIDNVAYLTGEGIDTATSVVETEYYGTKLTISHTQSIFKVLVKETNASNISINIYNLNGILLKSKAGSLTTGLNNFEIDISKLISGVYLYNITLDGITVKTGKINIVR